MNENIKAIAEEYANKVWNDKDITAVDKLVDENIVIHSPLGDYHGLPAMKKILRAWLKGFPDLIVENECVISERDNVSIQWRAKGTHHGEFKGRQPTGKAVAYSGVTVYRIKNEKIIEYWAYLDMKHLLGQI